MVDPGGSASGLARCGRRPAVWATVRARHRRRPDAARAGSGAGAAGSGSAGAGAAAGSGSRRVRRPARAGAASSRRGAAIGSGRRRCGDGSAARVRATARARVRRRARPEAAGGQERKHRCGRCGGRWRWNGNGRLGLRRRRPHQQRGDRAKARRGHRQYLRLDVDPHRCPPFRILSPKSVYWVLQFDYQNCYTCVRCDQEVNNLGQPEHVLLRSICNRPQQAPTVV